MELELDIYYLIGSLLFGLGVGLCSSYIVKFHNNKRMDLIKEGLTDLKQKANELSTVSERQ